jgi:hypothetical protein
MRRLIWDMVPSSFRNPARSFRSASSDGGRRSPFIGPPPSRKGRLNGGLFKRRVRKKEFAKKIGARLASPQPRPGIAGQWGRGITGWKNDAQAERSFQTAV